MAPYLDVKRDVSLEELPPLLSYHLVFLEVRTRHMHSCRCVWMYIWMVHNNHLHNSLSLVTITVYKMVVRGVDENNLSVSTYSYRH